MELRLDPLNNRVSLKSFKEMSGELKCDPIYTLKYQTLNKWRRIEVVILMQHYTK
jgi:hypothetical protein